MKLVALVLLLALQGEVQGFSTISSIRPRKALSSTQRYSIHSHFLPTSKTPSRQSGLHMSSDFDFPSAMPEKPQQTMEEKMVQSADDFITTMTTALGTKHIDGAPPELQGLKALREQNVTNSSVLAIRMYELMIERGMCYDADPETGALTPTAFDIPSNLDIPEVRAEFGHLYKYGMMLMDRGLLTVDQVKTTVLERLIKRTGLTPEEFDKWLGY